MTHRMPSCVRHTREMLEELERDHEMEVLRGYLSKFNLFPRNRDPTTAPIRYEELKELVKYWKLHRQRNFWRSHTQKEDLTKALHKHISTKILPNENLGTKTTPTVPSSSSVNENVSGHSPHPHPPQAASPSFLHASSTQSPNSKNENRKQFAPKNNTLVVNNLASGGKTYHGDLFSQRGEYDEGLLYLSRVSRPELAAKATKNEDTKQSEEEIKEDDGEEEFDDADLGISISINREKELKRKCACSLYQLTLEPGNESSIVREGSVPALIRLSIYDDVDTKRFCAGAIVNLTCDTSLCDRMTDEGILTALAELSKAQNEEIRRNTSIAMCRISYEKHGKLRLVQEGSVSAFLSMLNSPDNATKEACIKALINISSFSGASVNESVVSCLVRIAARPNEDDHEFTARAIFNLSIINGGRVKVIDDGLLEGILLLMKNTSNPKIQGLLATALFNFSGVSSNLEKMADRRMLECFDALLQAPPDVGRELTTAALANLTSNAKALRNIVTSTLCAQIIQLGHHPDGSVQESAALALCNMASLEENRPSMTRQGAIPVLIHLLKKGEVQAKQYAVMTICNLIVHPSTRAEVAQHNIVPSLISLASAPSENIWEICALALFNLSCDSALHALIVEENAINTLVKLANESVGFSKLSLLPDELASSKEVPLHAIQIYVLGSIFNVSFEPKSHFVFSQCNVLPMLSKLFTTNQRRKDIFMGQCAAIVCNWSFTPESQSHLIEHKAIDLIQHLIKGSVKETLLSCATALCNLSSKALHVCSDVLPMLIGLSYTNHHEITLTCAVAFCKLTTQASFRTILAHCRDVAPTLTVMMRSGVEEIQMNAATALCYLACERGTKKDEAIWNEGTVPDFIVNSLLRVNSESTKEICARGLFNLLTHEDCRNSIIEDGTLYALVKLARLESAEVRSLCVSALYNLSCDAFMLDTLMDMNVVRVITKISETNYSNQNIRQQLAACLSNVSTDVAHHQDKLLEGGILHAVQLLCKLEDPFCSRQCAATLCSLSFSEKCCMYMATESLLSTVLQMSTTLDKDQCSLAVNTLCNLTCHPSLHAQLVGGGAIDIIFSLLLNRNEDFIRNSGSKILHNLLHDVKHHTGMLEKNLILVLKTMLMQERDSSSSSEMAKVCIRMMLILSHEEAAWPRMVEEGAVHVIHIAVQNGEDSMISDCITTLYRLSRCEHASKTLLDQGILDVVAKAVAVAVVQTESSLGTSHDLARRCSLLLRNLSIHENGRTELASDERIPSVVQQLSTLNDRAIARDCSIILCNLTSRASTLPLASSEKIAALLIHLSSSAMNSDVKQVCAVALAQLHSTESNRSKARTQGLVTTLVSMLDMDPSNIMKVEKMISSLPTIALDLALPSWHSFPGDVYEHVAALPVNWAVHTQPLNDRYGTVLAPRTYTGRLPSLSARSTAGPRDRIHGSFEVMKVPVGKVIVSSSGDDKDRDRSCYSRSSGAFTLASTMPPTTPTPTESQLPGMQGVVDMTRAVVMEGDGEGDVASSRTNLVVQEHSSSSSSSSGSSQLAFEGGSGRNTFTVVKRLSQGKDDAQETVEESEGTESGALSHREAMETETREASLTVLPRSSVTKSGMITAKSTSSSFSSSRPSNSRGKSIQRRSFRGNV